MSTQMMHQQIADYFKTQPIVTQVYLNKSVMVS